MTKDTRKRRARTPEQGQAWFKKTEEPCLGKECEVWKECGGACHDAVIRERESKEDAQRVIAATEKLMDKRVANERARARSVHYSLGNAMFDSSPILSLATRLRRGETMISNLIVFLRHNKIPVWVCQRCGFVRQADDGRAATRMCDSCLASEPDPWAEEKK